MPKAIEAIIFDMDGVLVDSEKHWHTVAEPFFLQYIPMWDDKKALALVGRSSRDIYRLMVAEWGAKLALEEFSGFCHQAAQEVYLKRVSLLPGVRELLVEIKARAWSLALASSSPLSWVQMVLERFELHSYFTVVVTADHVARCKPAPDIFLLAASKLAIVPERCVVIEDSLPGVAAAKAAGMYCLAVTNTVSKEELSEADGVVSSLEELLGQGQSLFL
jgi:HAD superfamily hydrolase (TIGR01509 family)